MPSIRYTCMLHVPSDTACMYMYVHVHVRMCAPVTVFYASVDKLTTNSRCMTPAASDDARDHSRMQRLTHVLLDQSSITQTTVNQYKSPYIRTMTSLMFCAPRPNRSQHDQERRPVSRSGGSQAEPQAMTISRVLPASNYTNNVSYEQLCAVWELAVSRQPPRRVGVCVAVVCSLLHELYSFGHQLHQPRPARS